MHDKIKKSHIYYIYLFIYFFLGQLIVIKMNKKLNVCVATIKTEMINKILLRFCHIDLRF
jgi:hypothetical protein